VKRGMPSGAAALGVTLLGLVLTAPVLLPFAELVAESNRAQSSAALSTEGAMALRDWLGLVLPPHDGFMPDIEGQVLVGAPVLLMGYMNPVLQYGCEKFCADASAAGVDGLILPDLPIYEFESEYGPIIKKYGLDFIFLVTPETSEARIRKVDSLSSGFLYAVSSSSTTGKDKDMAGQQAYFERLQKMKLRNPVLAGFGIKDRQSFTEACAYTNGAIIGTAYIKALDKGPDIGTATKQFLTAILKEGSPQLGSGT